MMPLCRSCLTGLTGSKCILDEKSTVLREELSAIAKNRYGTQFLYPYLSTHEMRARQQVVASLMRSRRPHRIIDIGPYFSPMHQFIQDICPEQIVSLEVFGEASKVQPPFPGAHVRPYDSAELLCQDGRTTNVVVAPLTVQSFLSRASKMGDGVATDFDAVVCMGCDGAHGPSAQDILQMTSASTFDLYIEYPADYVPSVEAFSKLRGMGTIEFEATLMFHSLRNETEFTTRKMELIRITR